MNLKSKAIHDVFPLRAIEQDCLISVHGDLTVCFAVSLPEIFTLNASFDGVGEGVLGFHGLKGRPLQ
ncbi:MAG: DUF3875 domain-containing protein, partial [Pedobacter sp.]